MSSRCSHCMEQSLVQSASSSSSFVNMVLAVWKHFCAPNHPESQDLCCRLVRTLTLWEPVCPVQLVYHLWAPSSVSSFTSHNPLCACWFTGTRPTCSGHVVGTHTCSHNCIVGTLPFVPIEMESRDSAVRLFVLLGDDLCYGDIAAQFGLHIRIMSC